MHDIRPFIPELFSQPGNLLYIGARIDAHSWLEELYFAHNKITVLEVWPFNIKSLEDDYMITKLVEGDVRNVADIFPDTKFDYIFWWHGPEHLPQEQIEPLLHILESKCKMIALACPYGVYVQGAHAGNPYEVHSSTLYPEFFDRLGYLVTTDGLPNEVGSEIVAWKSMQ